LNDEHPRKKFIKEEIEISNLINEAKDARLKRDGENELNVK
jgi:hypothetical protein